MSDIRDDFEGTMMAVYCDNFRESTMIKTSLRIPSELLNVVDWVADQLGTSRQKVIVKILESGADEAFYGVTRAQSIEGMDAYKILDKLKGSLSDDASNSDEGLQQ